MDFLIDTNILIPAEPTSVAEIELGTPVVAELLRLIQETGGRALIHPDAFGEIARDRDTVRRTLRMSLLGKYPRVQSPPDLSDGLAAIIGRPEPGTHDEVDARLLEAVHAGHVGILITDDVALGRRAKAAGIGDSVLTSPEALELLRQLYEPLIPTPPTVERVSCSDLDVTDPIFDSLRRDYVRFDRWLAMAMRMRRIAWIIVNDDGSYAALVIVKEENPGEHGLRGKLLKMCTFKVSEDHRGSRFGELLLKPVLDHAKANGYDTVFVEAKPDNVELFSFLETFGFQDTGRMKDGTDPVYAKRLHIPEDGAPEIDNLTFHISFGPPALRWRGVPAFVVPIRPRYHERLFPEGERQLPLTPSSEPHANAIRKAYLCRASLRQVRPGDVLYFYRSRSQEVTVVGVVEDVHVLSEPSAIVRAAGKRTLYSYQDIESIAENGAEVLVIGFRQARVLDTPLPYAELLGAGVLRGAPQTVTRLSEEAATWLAQKLQL